jgi:hypothetical protein
VRVLRNERPDAHVISLCVDSMWLGAHLGKSQGEPQLRPSSEHLNRDSQAPLAPFNNRKCALREHSGSPRLAAIGAGPDFESEHSLTRLTPF